MCVCSSSILTTVKHLEQSVKFSVHGTQSWWCFIIKQIFFASVVNIIILSCWLLPIAVDKTLLHKNQVRSEIFWRLLKMLCSIWHYDWIVVQNEACRIRPMSVTFVNYCQIHFSIRCIRRYILYIYIICSVKFLLTKLSVLRLTGLEIREEISPPIFKK